MTGGLIWPQRLRWPTVVDILISAPAEAGAHLSNSRQADIVGDGLLPAQENSL